MPDNCNVIRHQPGSLEQVSKPELTTGRQHTESRGAELPGHGRIPQVLPERPRTRPHAGPFLQLGQLV